METTLPSTANSEVQQAIKMVDDKRKYTWEEIVDYFRESNEDEALDIYQICAWMSKQENIPTLKKYYYYFKAFTCSVIQIIGLIIFIYIQTDNIFEDKGICAMTNTEGGDQYANLTQILSVFFAVYISLKMGGLITDLGSKGLYMMNFWNGMNCPPFIDRRWVFFGGWINIFAICLSIYGSYIVLYISEDILDVILNAVALFFVVDVDDYILDSLDYQRVRDWFETIYNHDDYKNYAPQPVNKCALIFVNIITTIAFCAVALGLFGAVVAPFWIAICH